MSKLNLIFRLLHGRTAGVLCAGALALSMLLPARLAGQQAGVPGEPAAAQSPAGRESDYRLESGDVIDIRFFYNAELNTSVQIRPDGKISLPLQGEIEIAGLTIAEMSSRLASLYTGIVRRPEVTVQVLTFANRKIFVGGEVAKPGVFALTGRQTLMGALYEAGGLTRSAQRREVTVLRRSASGGAESIRVSLEQRLRAGGNPPGSPAAEFMLQPFDVVVVHESGVAKANRAVDQYVRQMIPVLLTAGFSYLINGGVIGQ